MADTANEMIIVPAGEPGFECVECAHAINTDPEREYMVGDVIECSTCGTEYEVVNVREDGVLELEMLLREK